MLSDEIKKQLKPGQTVRVHQKIQDISPKGEPRERIQMYEGIILARKHGSEAGATITVRKIAHGVGVEKILPLGLPTLEKIEIVKESKTRRAKLYFLRTSKRGLKERVNQAREPQCVIPHFPPQADPPCAEMRDPEK